MTPGLPLGKEAPVMTPKGVDFSTLFLCIGMTGNSMLQAYL